MAVLKLAKIRVVGMKEHYKMFIKELHKKGILHINKDSDTSIPAWFMS
jgi:hypothetical protein